jgi:hypothetical protein
MATMFATELRTWWQAEFGACPPVGYRLREAFPRRWVRFHSLPNAKRYAETTSDAVEILRRYNAVASALLGDGEPIVVVCTAYSDTEAPVPPADHHVLASLELVHLDTRAVDDPSMYWHFWAAPTSWRPGRFDDLLMRVANDEIANVLLAHPGRRAVFHPYDGGSDVIGADIFVCDSLRRDFRPWLSTLPSGL